MGIVLYRIVCSAGPLFTGSVHFFQANIPVFEVVFTRIKGCFLSGQLVGMYAARVGGIELSVTQKRVVLVELDSIAARMMRINSQDTPCKPSYRGINREVCEYIKSNGSVIFLTPPRAGLHDKVVARLLGDALRAVTMKA